MGGRGGCNRRGRFSIPPTPAGDFMRRHVLPTAFLTFVYLLAVAVGQPPQPAARFVSPPGATQPLVAPKLAPQPVDVDPVPDTLGGEFAIVATKDTVATDGTIATVEQTDDAVSVVPGELLTLTVRGDVVLPVDGQAVPAVSWAISRRTGNAKIYPADGHHVTFSAPAIEAGVYLFTAAVNNPDALGAPFMAARWVVVSGAQPPPDDVKPPKPPVDPPQPKPEPGKLASAYFVFIDSWQRRAESADLQSLGPESKTWAAIRAAGHKVANFDTEAAVTARDYAGYIDQAPVVLVFDHAAGDKFVGSKPVGSDAELRAAVKELAGVTVP